MKLVDNLIYDIIDQSISNHRKRTPESKANLVSLFLDSPGFHENNVNLRELRDIVLAFVIAGRDSTAQGVTWFFRALAMHPDVERKIRDEIHREVPELFENGIGFPNMEQVQRLTYLEAALRESLRLWPSVPANVREAVHDTVLSDGTKVRAGTFVVLPTYVLGRMTSVWGPDAKEFKPERWIDATTGKLVRVSPFKFNTFHAGPRICLGINLAMLEMKILATTVLSRFHLEMLAPEKVTYIHSISLPMRGQLNARVRMAAAAF